MNTFFKFLVFVLISSFLACSSSEREEKLRKQRQMQIQQQLVEFPDDFRSGLIKLLDNYFELKDGLVEADSELSAEKAAALDELAENLDTSGLNRETKMIWLTLRDSIINEAARLRKTKDIEQQRFVFEPLSESVIRLANVFRPAGYTIFHQSCPMVRGGSADWLSREEKIANPYHGDRMMHCGEIIETI